MKSMRDAPINDGFGALLDKRIDGLDAVRRLQRAAKHRPHTESMQCQRHLEAFFEAGRG